MATVILTSQPSTLSVVPNQNTTITVAASADFNVSSYTYQWKKSATAGGLIGAANNITGATGALYRFEPASGDNGYKYYCVVNGLSSTSSGEASQASVNSTGLTLTVASEATGIYNKWVPKGNDPNQLKESGAERFRRMHNLGYC